MQKELSFPLLGQDLPCGLAKGHAWSVWKWIRRPHYSQPTQAELSLAIKHTHLKHRAPWWLCCCKLRSCWPQLQPCHHQTQQQRQLQLLGHFVDSISNCNFPKGLPNPISDTCYCTQLQARVTCSVYSPQREKFHTQPQFWVQRSCKAWAHPQAPGNSYLFHLH